MKTTSDCPCPPRRCPHMQIPNLQNGKTWKGSQGTSILCFAYVSHLRGACPLSSEESCKMEKHGKAPKAHLFCVSLMCHTCGVHARYQVKSPAKWKNMERLPRHIYFVFRLCVTPAGCMPAIK